MLPELIDLTEVIMKKIVLYLLVIICTDALIAEKLREFTIFLSREKIAAEKIVKLEIDINKIKLMKTPLIKESDIVSYSARTHTIELLKNLWKKIMEIRRTTVFVVCVGEERIYWGVIWSSILSAWHIGIVIVKPAQLILEPCWSPKSYTIEIRCGYPTEEYFRGKDLRNDKRIIEALKRAGKLKE